MRAHRGLRSSSVTIRTLAAPAVLTLCVAEYIPKTITSIPGYRLLDGVSSVPAPISVAPDEANWAGIDGAWNTFSLRVGAQGTNTSVFVSTTNQQVWVVNAQACTSSVMNSLPLSAAQLSSGECDSVRGFPFNTSHSSTWFETGYYGLQALSELGVNAVGLFGLDTVSLGEAGPAVNTTIGTIGTHSTLATTEFWLGHIGLQSKPSTFVQQPSRPSYITGLFESQSIPSQSFGYTAGAQYRQGVTTAYHGSLTLGGYDASRLVHNDVVFTQDTQRNLLVGLSGLSATTTLAMDIDLLQGTNFDVYIDTNVAEIWLPASVCELFEETFGLVYDEASDLYLVNSTLHDSLTAQNPSITFTLRQAASIHAAGTVEITLPYAAFDLQAQPPYRDINYTTRYFPIRRGANETQWILGRTFMQEAYLKVDWERSQFQVSACDWTSKPTNIVAIVSPRYAEVVEDSSANLSTATIVGITIGVVAFVLLIAVGAYYVWRRRKPQQEKANLELSNSVPTASTDMRTTMSQNVAFTTASYARPLVYPKVELPGESKKSNARDPFADANAIEHPVYEMMGDVPIMEADGRHLSEKESMIIRERRINGIDPHATSATAPSPISKAPAAAPLSSMNDTMISSRLDGHDGGSALSAIAHPPSYNDQAHAETLLGGDLNRQRFSFES